MDRQKIASSFREVQEFICSKLEEIDGKSIFESDEWSRSEGGGGRTNTIKDGNIIENPIAFTDSFILPLGIQIWIPMNSSTSGLPKYQAFTVGGSLDNQRAGGFPLGAGLSIGGDDLEFQAILGNLYLPEYWANQTNFLGEADGKTLISREENQYNAYLIK